MIGNARAEIFLAFLFFFVVGAHGRLLTLRRRSSARSLCRLLWSCARLLLYCVVTVYVPLWYTHIYSAHTHASSIHSTMHGGPRRLRLSPSLDSPRSLDRWSRSGGARAARPARRTHTHKQRIAGTTTTTTTTTTKRRRRRNGSKQQAPERGRQWQGERGAGTHAPKQGRRRPRGLSATSLQQWCVRAGSMMRRCDGLADRSINRSIDWMDGRMDGWMMDGWMDRLIDGLIY
jgi:hypothetical protein